MARCFGGADIGGTKVEAALLGEKGEIIAGRGFSTGPFVEPGEVISQVGKHIADMVEDSGCGELKALGVGIAGRVDQETGAVIFSPNLGWEDVPLRRLLEAELGAPVVVTNDVTAATTGEWHYGAGRGMSDLVCLFVGTGIGGGIVSGGNLVVGATNTAGELGHITVVAGGRKCTCGGSGCLEAYAGGWAIAERVREEIARDPAAGENIMALAGAADKITARHVVEASREGDPLARHVVEDIIQYLAAGVVSVVNALNPECVILGGGVMEGMSEAVSEIERIVRRSAIPPAISSLQIKKSELGSMAGVLGAAYLAGGML